MNGCKTGSRRALLIGSGAFGLNLLTRLTTGLDLLAGGVFVLLVLWLEGARGRALWSRCRSYLAIALPVYLFFGLLDRVYQFYRFGSFFTTYMRLTAREMMQRESVAAGQLSLRDAFSRGLFRGALRAGKVDLPLRSAADPDDCAVRGGVETVQPAGEGVRPHRLPAAAGVYQFLCADIRCGAATRPGATATFLPRWNWRFCWLFRCCCVIATTLGKLVWGVAVALIAVSAVVQVASVAFWLSLEIYQMEILGHPTFVVPLRLENMIAFACGKMNAWGLGTHAMNEDAWDYVHIDTWNFLPFLLQRVGVAPAWAVNVAFAAWGAGLAALAWVALRLRMVLARLS